MLIANLRSLIADESGATAIEYGLIAALVSVAAIGALGTMGESLSSMFTTVSDKLKCAVDSAGVGCDVAPAGPNG